LALNAVFGRQGQAEHRKQLEFYCLPALTIYTTLIPVLGKVVFFFVGAFGLESCRDVQPFPPSATFTSISGKGSSITQHLLGILGGFN
jgi:hypothetical protein